MAFTRYEWTKADYYARNYVLLKLEDVARGLDDAAGDSRSSPVAARLAEKRAYAARAAMVKLSRATGE